MENEKKYYIKLYESTAWLGIAQFLLCRSLKDEDKRNERILDLDKGKFDIWWFNGVEPKAEDFQVLFTKEEIEEINPALMHLAVEYTGGVI